MNCCWYELLYIVLVSFELVKVCFLCASSFVCLLMLLKPFFPDFSELLYPFTEGGDNLCDVDGQVSVC